MTLSWITLYPSWYVRELDLLATHWPGFWVDEQQLGSGNLIVYGQLVVRPPGGTRRYPIRLRYPAGTPFEHPIVTPLEALPDPNKAIQSPRARFFDYRHQMPGGDLCLFQHETRISPTRNVLSCIDVLCRAEKWFVGHHTNHWPPDTAQSELEEHFYYVTDVLLAAPFLVREVEGYGRLFFVWDIRRKWETQHKELCPLLLTGLTREAGFITTVDARKELSYLYPWIDNRAWDPQKLAAVQDLGSFSSDRFEHGYWWSLPEEPRPFRTGEGLLRTLSGVAPNADAWTMVREQLRTDLSLARVLYFGLKYPGRQGGSEWLILCMPQSNRPQGTGVLIRSEHEQRSSFENASVYVVRTHQIRKEVLRLRNSGVVNNSISTRTVALIGLGALGGEVAELLCKAGVDHFRLCDSDRLTTGNVSRHVGGISDFGAPKTRAVSHRLLEINPYLELGQEDILNGSAVADLTTLSRFIGPADLTICTTADENVEAIINQVAVLIGKTILYGRAIRRAEMGRVFLVRPGIDACKNCLVLCSEDSRKGDTPPQGWIDIPETDTGELLHECGRPVIAGSAIDLSFVAGLIARVALDYLEDRIADKNHWVWVGKPAPGIDSRLACGRSTIATHLAPRIACPACQEPDVRELIITQGVKDQVTSLVESSPDKEMCGILVGYVDDMKRAIAVRAIGPGPRATRSRTTCQRDVEYIQHELNQSTDKLGEKGVYIGEWHSHLEPKPEPSPTDIQSLFGISGAINYLTRCPVMLIAGLDASTGKVTTYRSWAFQASGRMFCIANKTLPNDFIE